MTPRWWLAPDYEALTSDAEGLAFEFGKASVRALTEEQAIESTGQKHAAGHDNPLAKKWAENMTAHYEALSTKDTIFGQLRNCMDLAVVAALIQNRNLTEKCGWSMPLLLNPDLKAQRYHAPHTVDTLGSTVQQGQRLDHHRLGRRADQSLAAAGKSYDQRRPGQPAPAQGHGPHHHLVVGTKTARGPKLLQAKNWR